MADFWTNVKSPAVPIMEGIIGVGADMESAAGGPLPPEQEQAAKALASAMGLDIEEARAMVKANMSSADDEDPGDAIAQALAGAAIETVGMPLFNYNGKRNLPHWFPAALKPYAQGPDSPLKGVYDPYYGSLADAGDERVYMGAEGYRPPVTDKDHENLDVKPGQEGKLFGDAYASPKKRGRRRKRDKAVTYQQALNAPYTWEDDEVQSAMARFRKAGVNVRSFDELTQAWGSLVDRASKTYTLSQGKKKVTPWDVLEMHKKEQEAAGSLINFENGSQTQTATSVTEISEGASWSVLRSTLSQLLGRDPTDREIRDYTYRMNTLAAQNPSITETITRYKGGEAVSSNSKTTGGFDADDMAQSAYEQAQDDPEYARVQAGTTYYNSLLQAIGAVGDI